jgi:hypothetical protein
MAADDDAGDDGMQEMYEYIDQDYNVLITEENGRAVRYTDQNRYLNGLPLIEAFVEAVEFSDDGGFMPSRDPQVENGIKTLTLGEYFKFFDGAMNAYADEYVFSENVELFFTAYKHFAMGVEDFKHLDWPSIVEGNKALWQRCNEFVRYIRKECRSPHFKKRVYDREYKARANCESSIAYVNRLFDVKSRLNIVRVDLGYQKAYFSESGLAKARADLDKLLNNRRSNQLFDDMVGYIWKLEYGVHKGYHYHCMFFFDGSEVRKDTYYADMIGKYWVKQITAGAGTMYSCNAQKNKYRYCGIGMIDHSDVEKREHLARAIQYLAKKEQYLRMKLIGRPRLFGRGKMPPLPLQKLGRPRKD